ncbi:hypothetical protein [Trujillonella humicola]|uniref:hypothetical protein n=1 Tax=Trujillonella humicola TaxID=3383699 RepID=UPI003905DCA4
MTVPEDPRARFRSLPEPVGPEDTVESLDTSVLPGPDDDPEHDRMLRTSAG